MADAAVAPENHNFGIQDLWDSGPVSKVLLVILVIMSLYSWYVLIVKYLDRTRSTSTRRRSTRTSGVLPRSPTVSRA